MSNAIATISNELAARTLNVQTLVVLTPKQTAQLALIQDRAECGDFADLMLSHDRAIASIASSAVESRRIVEEIVKYEATNNASGLSRLVATLIGTSGIPQMGAKKAEILGFESRVHTWAHFSGDTARAPKTIELYKRRAAFLAPVFAAIARVNTVPAAPTAPTLAPVDAPTATA